MAKVFAVTSWGNAGVPFILKCLNAHPHVKAYANLRYASLSPLGVEASAAEYLDAIGRLNWPDCVTCGDVHGVGPHELPGLHKVFGETFVGAHLVGHPIQRIAGSLLYSAEVGRNWSYDDFRKMWNFEPNDPKALKYLEAIGPQGNYVVANYMIHVNAITSLANVHGPRADPLIPIEPLLGSQEAWDSLIAYLSGGVIDRFGDHWRAFQGDVPNVAHTPFTTTPKAVWDSFDDDVRRVIAGTMTEWAGKVYESLGYDMSFVR